MNAIQQAITTATEAYLKAYERDSMNEYIAAAHDLYEALGQPLGGGLVWVWLRFETWTTTN